MYCDKIVISDATTQRVNLEMELLHPKMYIRGNVAVKIFIPISYMRVKSLLYPLSKSN